MCLFGGSTPTPKPDPDVEIERENQEAAEKAKKDKQKQQNLADKVAASGGSGGTTVPSLLTSTAGGVGYYNETL